MGYTRAEIIEKFKHAFQNKDKFYKEDFVNYRGVTADTKEYYTEVVAEFLCENIDVYINGIQCISRTSSYKTGAHEKVELSGSNREEENIAKKIYLQSQEHGPFDHIGAILDYQTPLKAKADDKAGKIDLLSFDGKVMHILELKKPASEETMLRCVLEGFTYLKTVDTKKLISDFGYDPEGVEVKASPFVFCGSDQCSEMLQDRPFLRQLMSLLDSKPYYIAGQDMYTVIEDVIPGIRISGDRTYDMTVRNRMQVKYPEELMGKLSGESIRPYF